MQGPSSLALGAPGHGAKAAAFHSPALSRRACIARCHPAAGGHVFSGPTRRRRQTVVHFCCPGPPRCHDTPSGGRGCRGDRPGRCAGRGGPAAGGWLRHRRAAARVGRVAACVSVAGRRWPADSTALCYLSILLGCEMREGCAACSPPCSRCPRTATSHPPCLHAACCRSLADLFAGDPECAAAAGKGKGDKGRAGLARTHAFAGAGLDDELELRKLQVGGCGSTSDGGMNAGLAGSWRLCADMHVAPVGAAVRCPCASAHPGGAAGGPAHSPARCPPSPPRFRPPSPKHHTLAARSLCASGPR